MNDDLDQRLQDLLAKRGSVGGDPVERVLATIEVLPERGAARRARTPFAAMAAVVLVAVVGLAIAMSLRGPAEVATPTTPLPSISSPAVSPSTTIATPQPTPTLQTRPVWAMDLASHLDCDGGPLTDVGMDVPTKPGPIDPVADPEAALDVARRSFQSLPISGFTPALIDGHWALYRYLVNGRPKVHAVATNQFPEAPDETGWDLVGLRLCDYSEFADAEFGPDANRIWRDQTGDPVRTDRITSRNGSAHCGWDEMTFLSWFDPAYTQYVRDPSGELEQDLVVPFDADVRLPKDAIDMGLKTDEWHLFTIPSGRAVFMQTVDGTYELWPRVKEAIGCI